VSLTSHTAPVLLGKTPRSDADTVRSAILRVCVNVIGRALREVEQSLPRAQHYHAGRGLAAASRQVVYEHDRRVILAA
jgi:hypothetical protein